MIGIVEPSMNPFGLTCGEPLLTSTTAGSNEEAEALKQSEYMCRLP